MGLFFSYLVSKPHVIVWKYLSSKDSSVGSMLDWYHEGCGFKSRLRIGISKSEFELQ